MNQTRLSRGRPPPSSARRVWQLVARAELSRARNEDARDTYTSICQYASYMTRRRNRHIVAVAWRARLARFELIARAQ